jgi:23S rRNA pseudouridine1911/1915/1917 synthase
MVRVHSGLPYASVLMFFSSDVLVPPSSVLPRSAYEYFLSEPASRASGKAHCSIMKRLSRKSSHSSGPRRPRFSREVAILYEDDAVVVLNKPPGLLAVPIEGSHTPSALSLLSAELKTKKQRAFIVHRIDRFASGVLLFAKTARDRDKLVRQFLAHAPLREYLAMVRGHLANQEGPLVHHFRRQGMFQRLSSEKDRKAARAELRYRVEQVLRGASLVRVRLQTGLQNQIRAQFSALGHPVIGDRKYSTQEASERRIDRVALHAARLEFVHPRSGENIAIDCEPPQDFRSLLLALSLPKSAN